MLDLLLLACIIVFIIDLSGFIPEMSERIWKILYKNVKYVDWIIPKPFSCSLCMVFWIGVIYLIFTGFSLYMLAYVALLAFLTPVIKDVLLYVRELLIYFTNKLYELIN